MRKTIPAPLLLTICVAGLLAVQIPPVLRPLEAAQARPLPDVQTFYRETRANLERSQREQGGFAYKERRTEVHVNPFGKVGTSGETAAYEITPEPDGSRLRRLIERNGKPVAGETAERVARRADDPRARDRRSVWEDTIATLQLTMDRREVRNGRDVIVVLFEPNPAARPETREGRMARLFKGAIFIDEATREVVHVDATAIDTISIGLGVVARLNEGSTVTLIREKVTESTWLPTSIRFKGQGRALLLRKLALDHVIEWFDYRRVHVSSE